MQSSVLDQEIHPQKQGKSNERHLKKHHEPNALLFPQRLNRRVTSSIEAPIFIKHKIP